MTGRDATREERRADKALRASLAERQESDRVAAYHAEVQRLRDLQRNKH